MSQKRKIVALDGDGVLLDFDKAFQRHMEYKLGRKLPVLSRSYDLGKRYGLDGFGFWSDLASDEVFWSSIPLLPHAKDLVYALEDIGFEVWVVTAIGENMRQSRAVSLSGLVPKGRIICSGWSSYAMEKIEVLHDLDAVGFLDDRCEPVFHATMLPKMRCARLYHSGALDIGVVPDVVDVIDDAMDFPAILESSKKYSGAIC